MYRYSNGQISLSDFQQPMGMCLREDNRWVKKAQLLPWDKIEAKYAGLFPSATGNVAKPLQLALGACLIQREYGYSDEEIVLQIQENPYLQYFCGYAGYDDSKPPFDSSSMVHFRKRLTPEILVEINEMVIQVAEKKNDQNNSEVERKFSLGKRKCGMGLVTAKLEETTAHVVALSILLLNLRKIQCAFLQFWDWLLGFLQPCEKLGVGQ